MRSPVLDLICNKSIDEINEILWVLFLNQAALLTHNCSPNQGFIFDSVTGRGRCVCLEGRQCEQDPMDSSSALVLGLLIFLALIARVIVDIVGGFYAMDNGRLGYAS